MPPQDKTPLGDEMVERLPGRKFPQAKPSGDRAGESSDDSGQEIERRPPLPNRSEPMAADIEDEEADPVIDSGPGIDDGPGRVNSPGG